MASRNGRPQLPPVPAILPGATPMDNADPRAPILGIIGAPAASRRKPPSNLQGQASYEPVKACSKRHTGRSPWMNEAAILTKPHRRLRCHQPAGAQKASNDINHTSSHGMNEQDGHWH
ncbi:hypothetical protein CSAL01_01301 [Colletotrichum salicis]|uniref:Uncharacterized protein n=1 Tax=Colletotrichum salicis TaxID=1209931 RepID=A0A135TYZ7_9PEZI|nr:hypothetical protein CSAL01_01301 [Colletotrichum salicis]